MNRIEAREIATNEINLGHHSIPLEKASIFKKIASKSNEKWPSYAHLKVARQCGSWLTTIPHVMCPSARANRTHNMW